MSDDPKTIIVWFRQALRLADNPALSAAVDDADVVVPVFVWAPDEHGDWPPGGAHRVWLDASLRALDGDLRDKGSRLVIRTGESESQLIDIARKVGATAVYADRLYEPALRKRDDAVADALANAPGGDDIRLRRFDSLLHDPEEVRTQAGDPYRVFTPFWNKVSDALDVGPPLPVPRMGERLAPPSWPDGASVDDLDLSAKAQDGVAWSDGILDFWKPGEAGARARLDEFVDGENGLQGYDEGRDRPAAEHTSMLSPHLHWGEISPRQIWTRVQSWVSNGAMKKHADSFLSELGWREFSHHLLHHYPKTPSEPLKDKFEEFRWRRNQTRQQAWQRGRTGYPIVDAGMRQLYEIGWMHNRVRMIVASFLTKDLLVPWQEGAQWFWDTLVGGDLANNTQGWQWSAGCGADAQPFFRVFNPVTQGERFDPDGEYVRRWVPELAELPTKHVHAPWDAPDDVLEEAGIALGDTYPAPIVDHGEAREKALARLDEI